VKKLMEANRTVNQIFKLNRQDKIWENVIEEFLAEGEKTFHLIQKAIARFFGDIYKSLNEFKEATLPIFYLFEVPRDLKGQRERRGLDTKEESKLRRRRGKGIDSQLFLETIR
jgi:hypothetical protein